MHLIISTGSKLLNLAALNLNIDAGVTTVVYNCCYLSLFLRMLLLLMLRPTSANVMSDISAQQDPPFSFAITVTDD